MKIRIFKVPINHVSLLMAVILFIFNIVFVCPVFSENVIFDPLNNFSLLHEYSDNLKIDTNNPGNFNSDSGRVVRTSSASAFLVYKVDSMADFSVGFWGVDQESGNVSVLESEDGNNYSVVSLDSISQSYGYRYLRTYSAGESLKQNSRYLKIILAGGQSWKGQIGSVSILSDRNERQDSQVIYVDSENGSDDNSGFSKQEAIKTLAKLNQIGIISGDSVLLKSGQTFLGKIEIVNAADQKYPVFIGKYGGEERAVINSAGYLAGILISDAGNIKVSDLEITSDAGEPVESEALTRRYGVYVSSHAQGEYRNIRLSNLYIHHIFATQSIENDGQNPTSNMGMGINIAMQNQDARLSSIYIEDCNISMVGHTGIKIFGMGSGEETTYLDSVFIFNNFLEHIGGPGMVPGRCSNVIVRGNTVNYSGSGADPRMHNRGSGIWPWTCKNVIIEKNRFMHAWGKYDSCGAHIDFNCSNVIVQYNFSFDNAGGFVEILGNDQNCVYRYNVSVNDGYRKNGVNGALSDGHIFWISGYVGSGKDPIGASECRIYNNTIYTAPHIKTGIRLQSGTKNNRIENNILYMEGDLSYENLGDNNTFDNNIYFGHFPKMPFGNHAVFADPGLINPGDTVPDAYKLLENSLAINTGKVIDDEVSSDFWGNPVSNKTPIDRGAHETSYANTGNYTIYSSVETEGGNIYPSGEIEFRENIDVPFTIFPNPGFVIEEVIVDGVSVGIDSVFIFEKLSDNHQIKVKFTAPAGSVTDPLDNFSIVALHSSNMKIQTENPENLGGDAGRAARTNTEDGFIMYKFKNITDFEIIFWGINGDNGKLNVYTSIDGINYDRMLLKTKSFLDFGYRYKTVYKPQNTVPGNTNLLKVELTGSDAWWKPQIGSVFLEWLGDENQTGLNIKARNMIKTFPNPVQQKLYITSLEKEMDFKIFNINGKLVLYGTCISEIDIAPLETGLYFISLGNMFRTKFVKSKYY